jgi:hypothetical protein
VIKATPGRLPSGMSNGRRVVSSAFQRWATRLDRPEVDPDVARCHAKRHHVEHAGFRNTGRAVAASRSESAQHHEQRFWTAAVSYASAVRAIASGCHLCHIDCAGSNPGRTTLPHVERQRWLVTAAARWLRRASGDRSKKTANRTAVATPGPSRALSQSR